MSKADLEEIQKATGMSLGGASIPDALSKAKQSRGEKKARKVNLDELPVYVLNPLIRPMCHSCFMYIINA